MQFKQNSYYKSQNILYPDVDPTCHTCDSAPASLIHKYRSCPLLKVWTSVFQTISKILNHQIESNPLSAIFGVTPDLDLANVKLKVLAFTSLLARRAILHEGHYALYELGENMPHNSRIRQKILQGMAPLRDTF